MYGTNAFPMVKGKIFYSRRNEWFSQLQQNFVAFQNYLKLTNSTEVQSGASTPQGKYFKNAYQSNCILIYPYVTTR